MGAKRRGDRSSLVLEKRPAQTARSSRSTNGRAVPPPMTKGEWVAFQKKYVRLSALAHTDGAVAYRTTASGVMHDAVRHSRGGQTRGEYTKVVKHTRNDGKTLSAVAGTQSLDGWWKTGKRNCDGVRASYEGAVDDRVREAQWRHWVGSKDRWVEAGKVIAWVPR